MLLLYGAATQLTPVLPGLPVLLGLSGVRAGNILGSRYGGWGFNPYWDISGSNLTINVGGTNVQIYQTIEARSPADTVTISPDELRTNSFFLPFLDSRMYQAEGSTLATNPVVRTKLLAEAIPARTFATGANPLVNDQNKVIGVAGFNMNAAFQQRGWPLERRLDKRRRQRWLHSDVRDIPYLYNGSVFNKWVELGGGR